MSDLEPELREIARALRQLILEARPDLSESIKWGNPVYETNGRVCYLAATKSYISLGFFNGASLANPEGRIEGTGKKMRHVKVRALGDIHRGQYTAWVREATEFNHPEAS